MTVLLTVAIFWVAAAMSPGPAFFVVVHEAASRGRSSAFQTVAGLMVSLAGWASLSLFGLRALLDAAPRLEWGLRLAGAAYLAYLGLGLLRKGLRHARFSWLGRGSSGAVPLALSERADRRELTGFFRGLLTNLTNPKTMVLTGSLFAVVLPKDTPLPLGIASIFVIVAVSTTWYLLVSMLLAAPPLQRVYRRFAPNFDVASGLIFLGLGGLMLFHH